MPYKALFTLILIVTQSEEKDASIQNLVTNSLKGDMIQVNANHSTVLSR